jgi:hypothetical protein
MPAQIAVYLNPHTDEWTVLVHTPYINKQGAIVMDRKYTTYDTKEKADGAAREFAKALVLAERPEVTIIEEGPGGQPKVVWSHKK